MGFRDAAAKKQNLETPKEGNAIIFLNSFVIALPMLDCLFNFGS